MLSRCKGGSSHGTCATTPRLKILALPLQVQAVRPLDGRSRGSTPRPGPRLTGHDDFDFEGLRLSCVSGH